MTLLTPESLAMTVSTSQAPCLSLYQPTHRHHPDNQQDAIRFRNLVKQLEASLTQSYSAADSKALLEPFEKLAQDVHFWNCALDGLAVLSAPGLFQVFRLQRPVKELAIVAASFHTKPLRRFLQSVDRYQVLALSLDKIRLFEGSRDALDELDLLPEVPRTITDALGEELSDAHQTVAAYGGVGGGDRDMRHGHGSKKDEVDVDRERFFRAIDRAVSAHYSKPSGLPLLLAALPEHHDPFRRVSHNARLAQEAIAIDPSSLSPEELRPLAWAAIQPQHDARVAAWTAEFAQAQANGLGSDDLASVARAAVAGRVKTLLTDGDRQIGGRLDQETGEITGSDLNDPCTDDLLDDLAEVVAQKGGEVVVLNAEQMPGQSGLVAVYRY